MSTFEMGTVQCPAGSREVGVIEAGHLEDGSAIEIPLVVMNGVNPGPVLWLGGALHGPELNGTEIIRRVIHELVDPQQLNGTIVGAPVQNPLGMRDHHRLILREGADINRAFPGKEYGTLAQHIAYRLFHEGFSRADCVIDIHANVHPGVDFILVRGDETEAGERSRELAELFGWTIVLSILAEEAQMTGTLMDAALGAGIPAMTLEATPQRELHDDSISSACDGILNVMRELGMLEGAAVKPTDRQPIPELLGNTVQVASRRGGFVYPLREVGTTVKKGDPVALIRDAFGDEVETVASPIDGYVTVYPRDLNQTSHTGRTVVFVNPIRSS